MKVLVFVLVFLLTISTVFFLFRDYEITNYPTKVDGPIIAFGDSLVEGVGAKPDESFVSRLSEKIDEPIINMGVAGDTTQNGLGRLNTLLDKKPRIVLLLLGGNDYLRRISKEETFNNLRTMIKRIQDTGAIVILLGVRGGLLQDHYDNEYKRLAKDTGSVYVENVLAGLINNPEFMYDSIHPNALGYEKIAEKIYPKLVEVLE